jgi:patatin-related protein
MTMASEIASMQPRTVSESNAPPGPESGYAPEREIRLAVVMYGGVSLAIYMYGVAQELLNLVKATAPAEPGSSDPGGLAFAEDDTTLPVYRRLARFLSRSGDGSGPVRVRFVVDLVSGSSAGGLNGVCLASALANDRPGSNTRLEPLEELWVKHGDLDALFAGPDSERDEAGALDPELKMPKAPPSLLNGLRFYKLLARTLHDQLAGKPGDESLRSRLVDQLDLWVTATDLDGKRVEIPIKNATVSERQHAYRFHFVYDPVQRQNDFTKDAAPFVAFAGRSTSSFPVAFEPMRLERIVHFPIGPDWTERFYPDDNPEAFAHIPLSDGGILDNKPFSYATQELTRRPATLPVERFLLYVEPDPKPAQVEPPPHEWNALETAIAALTGIPRSETIRGDLELVRRRNQAIRRARRLLFQSALTPSQQAQNARIVHRLERERWLAMGFQEMVAAESQFGPTYPVYHRLKVGVVCDYLARLLARTLDVDEEGEDVPKLRAIVDAWKRDRYQEEPAPRREGDVFPRTESEFLFRFDLPFRIRRLTFVLSHLRELESEDTARIEGFFQSAGSNEPPAFEQAQLQAIRRALSAALNRLVEVEQRLPKGGPLRDALAQGGIDAASLSAMAGQDEDSLRAQVPAALTGSGNPFDTIIHDAIWDVTEQARAAVEAALGERHTETEVEDRTQAGDAELTRAVRFHYDAFEAVDLVYLPLSFETAIADTNPVTIIRVSPLDATKPGGVSRSLKGSALSHFAAFTDSSWRQHDIAWGRLNASEILIRNLLPEGHPEAEALIADAHAVIESHYQLTARPVLPKRATTKVGADGLPLLADVPITEGPHWSGSLRHGAGIASVTAQDQLRRREREKAAKAVRLATEAAEGAGTLALAGGFYGLLAGKAKKIIWTMTLGLLLLGIASLLASLPAKDRTEDGLIFVAALTLGLLVGAAGLALLGVRIGGSRIRATIDKTLARF